MTILIADNPGTNSYLTSLIDAYKKAGLEVICGLHNFFYSNLVPDVLHIQWPEKIYNWYPFNVLDDEEKYKEIEKRLNWYKEKKAFIVHTIHNIKPHIPEKLNFEEKIFSLIINYSDLLSHHCEKSIELLKDNYPDSAGKKSIINHHGDYLIDYKNISKTEARRKLGIDQNKFVILNFGSQQKYKGEEFIETVFQKLPVKEKFLLTAGNYRYAGYSEIGTILRKIKNSRRIRNNSGNRKYIYKTIAPNEVSYYFSACDIVLLAHQGSLNSGLLPLAATHAKPVIFPDTGCFKEQMHNWIFESYESGNESSAAGTIMNLYHKVKDMGAEKLDNSIWLKENSWEKHVRLILDEVKKIKKVNEEF